MKSIKMSYKGCTFEANPKTVSAELSKHTAATPIPFKKTGVKEICELPVIIKGSGHIYSSEARAKMQELTAVFKQNGSAYLFSPVLSPMKAYFSRLSFSIDAEHDRIEYRFEFTEDVQNKKARYDFGYTPAKQGENLFDIANRTDTDIETLFDLNCFETPFDVEEGDRVWLR